MFRVKYILIFLLLILSSCGCNNEKVPNDLEPYKVDLDMYVRDRLGNDYIIFDVYKEERFIVLNGNFKFDNFENFRRIYYLNSSEIFINLEKTVQENNLDEYNLYNFNYQGKLLLYFDEARFNYDVESWCFNLQINLEEVKNRDTYFEVKLTDVRNLS